MIEEYELIQQELNTYLEDNERGRLIKIRDDFPEIIKEYEYEIDRYDGFSDNQNKYDNLISMIKIGKRLGVQFEEVTTIDKAHKYIKEHVEKIAVKQERNQKLERLLKDIVRSKTISELNKNIRIMEESL